MFSKTSYLYSPSPKLIDMTAYSDKTNFRSVCAILRKVVTKNRPYKCSHKHVIWIRQGLNRSLWSLIATKQTFVMFVQSCEKLYRKTFDTNVLNNLFF